MEISSDEPPIFVGVRLLLLLLLLVVVGLLVVVLTFLAWWGGARRGLKLHTQRIHNTRKHVGNHLLVRNSSQEQKLKMPVIEVVSNVRT
jgi:hypothetical protein